MLFSDTTYRMVFAVVTTERVILYDTQQLAPFAMVAHLHYAPLSDIAWSADGLTLALASHDGYCSLVTFDEVSPWPPSTLAISRVSSAGVCSACNVTGSAAVFRGLPRRPSSAWPVAHRCSLASPGAR